MGEYISKDALMKAFAIRVAHGTSVPEWNDAIDIAESIPPADVVEVWHGRWEPVKGYTGVEAFGFREETVVALRCSVCDGEIDPSEGWAKYCPNCGAKMDKDGDGE